MRKSSLFATLLLAVLLCLSATFPCFAQQTNPGWTFGYVPTPGEWNFWFGKKVDWQGALPCVVTGCTFTGPIINTSTTPAIATAGGQTVVTGTITAPTMTATAQAWMFNSATNGAVIQGDGSSNDFVFLNKNAGIICQGLTGSTEMLCGLLGANNTGAITQAAGVTFVSGAITAPALTTNDQAYFYNVATAGAVMQGIGSASDVALINKSAAQVCIVPTGTQTFLCNGGIGYNPGVGTGGAVTQATSRTTGVTLNKITGAITLVSAAGNSCSAGLANALTFTVTDSAVAVNDSISLSQQSGTDVYAILKATNVAAGSFKVTFCTTGGTTTEQPIFNFAVIKGSAT